MTAILTRCRDAEMLGPVCDVISDEKPLTETIKELRVNAGVHNESDITDNDVEEMEELLMEGEGCCCCEDDFC